SRTCLAPSARTSSRITAPQTFPPESASRSLSSRRPAPVTDAPASCAIAHKRRKTPGIQWIIVTQYRGRTDMKTTIALALAVLGSALGTACSRDAQAMDAQQIEHQYGVSGGYTDTVATSDGPVRGTLVPITLANGRQGQLFIPERQR